MNEVILTEQLTKHYGNVEAVKDLNLSIGKSEIYGFLGLNGAGKTTTIRMLLGMINQAVAIVFSMVLKLAAHKPKMQHKSGIELVHWSKFRMLIQILLLRKILKFFAE
jgi:ABC-type multidrug transport system ATPase subunit